MSSKTYSSLERAPTAFIRAVSDSSNGSGTAMVTVDMRGVCPARMFEASRTKNTAILAVRAMTVILPLSLLMP